MSSSAAGGEADVPDCRTCGACCAFSRDWPRFTLETDADIARIPEALVCETASGMRCIGDRCSALIGEVGVATACSIYSVRPDVCRACEPGDDACRIARRHFFLDVDAPQKPSRSATCAGT
jgi:uncharacterized protein